MNKLALESVLPRGLAALERALAPDGVSSLDPMVPTALWRLALAGPAADFLARPGKELRTSIVRAGWALGGGGPTAMPDRLANVLELLHAGSLIVDDVEDGSELRRGTPALHRMVGVPLAINTGSWMYFWALAELAELQLDGAVELAVRTLVRCHQGQALDLAVRVVDLDVVYASSVVETMTNLKTGQLCRLAGELGAIAAGAPAASRAAIGQFAETAGVALQMLDDLGSLASRRDKGLEDLRNARATWPWAWLADRDPFAWSRLVGMARQVVAGEGDANALADELVALVGATGRDRIRATLDGAAAGLVIALGSSPAVDAVIAELRRMETSYG